MTATPRTRMIRPQFAARGVAAWRRRMGTDAAKEIYKERAATVECVNTRACNRGLTRFLVRGVEKVLAAALWPAPGG